MRAFDILYDHQQKAVLATENASKGSICMPTGVGKTFCQAAIIADEIQKNPHRFRMYVVNAPRIMLSFQLMREMYGFLIKNNIDARYMFVHSGGSADVKEMEEIRIKANKEIHFAQIPSATSPVEIGNMMLKVQKQGLPIIFFSTYNSAERIQNAIDRLAKNEENPIYLPPVSIVMNDEAHYLVQEQFHDILHILNSNRCYFFTATMIHTASPDGMGMNNENLFGKVLYQMKPIEAIRLGKMVRPRVHVVFTEGNYTTEDYIKSLSKVIADTFKQHEKVLIKMKPKILVSTKGTQDIIDFLKSDEYRSLRAEGVDIYAVSSNEDINNDINGEKVRRQEFLKRLKRDGNDHNKRLIVLHYDILAEGIDVSGFTGIMPLRTLNKSKFLQTFGRSARPDFEDRPKIDAIVDAKGEMRDADWNTMNKPYAYIMIPCIIHTNKDDKENMMQLIRELRSYGFKAEDIITSQYIDAPPKKEQPDPLNPDGNRVIHQGQVIEELQMELEAEEDARLDDIALANKILSKQ